MSQKPKITIVHRAQFGYHTDVLKWCENLRDHYHIMVICFDDGYAKYVMNGVVVYYVSNKGGKIVKWIRFLLWCFWLLAAFKGIILVSHFTDSYLLKRMMPWRRMILDIRTFSVNPDERIRQKENENMFRSVRLFDYVTVISEGLRKQLPKSADRTAVLPLGADLIKTPCKNYERLDLLYVGTFFNRNLGETIKGFAIAENKLKGLIQMKYHIVGFGPGSEEDSLLQLVRENGLENNVVFYGRLPHNQLNKFYEMCNIGVSFVPIVPYYDYQPVTKSFEYVMAGLYTIATATYSNKEIISPQNGVLINDDAESFSRAICQIYHNRSSINSEVIRHSLDKYSWDEIVKTILRVILEDFKWKCLSD